MSPPALFNGSLRVPDLSAHRGLHYGDGVFRTCLIYDSQIIDFEKQIHKLSVDAARLWLTASSAELRRDLRKLAADRPRAVAKIMLIRQGGERGYRTAATKADRLLLRYPAPSFPAAAWTHGISAGKSDVRLAAQPQLAGIKHLNRLEQVLAGRNWTGHAAELIVNDDRGRPLSGTRSNLFWVSGGRLRTPALDRCGVAGIMRDKVLALAGTLKLELQVGAGSWDELASADEAFVTNSLIGIWPLARLGTRRWRAPGPMTRELMRHLDHPRLTA